MTEKTPNIVALDFETHFSKSYSLSKISTRDYCTDYQFEAILCAMKINGGETMVFERPQIKEALSMIDWDNACLVAHNCRFDASVLGYHFGIHPKMYACTMAMAQATVFPHTGSASLAKVADFFGLPPKGTAIYSAWGKRYSDFTKIELQEYKDYCEHDNDLCWDILNLIHREYEFPQSEMKLIHHNIKSYVEPVLELDADVLAEHLNEVRSNKDYLINIACMQGGASVESLGSNPQFAEVLEALGVDPIPMKVSQTTGKKTWAFAKSDWEFKKLLEHDNPAVQAVMAARMGVKSTLEETRTERLLEIAKRHETLHVPLKYAGAHTLRFSGDEKLNLQNLTRGSRIREAIKAPEGCKIVAADASQIEARVLACFAGQEELVEQFAAGEDVYSTFASRVYDKPINKTDNPVERFTGKVGVLSLGYGCGYERFYHMLRNQSEDPSTVDQLLATKVVDIYREEYKDIKRLWYWFDGQLDDMETGTNTLKKGPITIDGQQIKLPNGTLLQYPGLHKDKKRDEYVYGGKRAKTLYGAKLVENIVQALARIITMDVIARMDGHDVARYAMSVHDELVFVVRENRAEQFLEQLLAEMRVPPSWMPDLPLDAEGGIGDNYGEVK